ncbi:hypothetical protein GM415_15490 [Pseudodesulfovibrio cashew]|uniref:Uncharacterized protein n=1 Tax=Pseudodesulfovibrio cashew TaxID=2678688 RepID=A0A6I6JJY6_9BACT|nr:hypothetical protein [Pseudodesulfovibrio cashew]QGY41459.1 hypothetical protein GM415_15490 [Pseudodesulfovibrio cashew]
MARVMVLHVKNMVETQRFRRHVKTALVDDGNGKKVRKTVWGYELVGKRRVVRPELSDCSHGPGDVVVSSYGRRYVMTDEGSLRRVGV